MGIKEIRKLLNENSTEETKQSFKKFVPSSEKVYGVKVPFLNKLASKFKDGGFELVESLWKSGAFEEKLLAAKILGKICKKDQEKTISLIKKFSKEINDWAVCDTLATQGIRKIAKIKQEEIFGISKKLIKSKNPWERRFATVLLINYASDKKLKSEIKNILKSVENDDDYYVKKAFEWVKRKLKPKSLLV